jgi:hypothetical protein
VFDHCCRPGGRGPPFRNAHHLPAVASGLFACFRFVSCASDWLILCDWWVLSLALARAISSLYLFTFLPFLHLNCVLTGFRVLCEFGTNLLAVHLRRWSSRAALRPFPTPPALHVRTFPLLYTPWNNPSVGLDLYGFTFNCYSENWAQDLICLGCCASVHLVTLALGRAIHHPPQNSHARPIMTLG